MLFRVPQQLPKLIMKMGQPWIWIRKRRNTPKLKLKTESESEKGRNWIWKRKTGVSYDMEIYARRSLYWMELESQSQQFTQSPWSDRAAQIVKPSDLCHVHVESVPFAWYGLLPWPSDCRQVAYIQRKDPRVVQSRRGVHLATGSEGSKYTTWCPSN